uniref:Uncharacterized protein n=1 Tax=Micrurus lemniscatus lemniscatus TaxID=129467 RepID=A0A2D4HBY0_MICLE
MGYQPILKAKPIKTELQKIKHPFHSVKCSLFFRDPVKLARTLLAKDGLLSEENCGQVITRVLFNIMTPVIRLVAFKSGELKHLQFQTLFLSFLQLPFPFLRCLFLLLLLVSTTKVQVQRQEMPPCLQRVYMHAR